MALTADQLANTTADAFDVRLRFFAADDLLKNIADLSTFAVTDAAPSGWTVADDTITPAAGWTECTTSVVHEGSFAEQWDGGRTYWQATLQGINYTVGRFGPGRGLCCLRRILQGACDSGWVLWWIGVIDSSQYDDDYRNGAAWRATVRSIDATLATTDAPRIVTSSLNVLEGSTVTASSTLATPGSEAGTGEFIGSTANVDPGNIVDGRMSTLWISQSAPTVTNEAVYETGDLDVLFVDEVFCWPIAGYSQTTSWWVEILNRSNVYTIDFGTKVDATGVRVATCYALYTVNQAGQSVMMPFSTTIGRSDQPEYTLEPGERMIICGDQRVFDAYTGGATNAKYVFEAKSWKTVAPDDDMVATDTELDFNIGIIDGSGYVLFGTVWNEYHWSGPHSDVVKFGTGIAVPAVFGGWSGDGVDVSAMVAGQSLRRVPSGTDTDSAADWQAEDYPSPGDKWAPDNYEWVQIETQEHTSSLASESAAGATELSIAEGTTGWLAAGSGLLDWEAFTYTGRTATTLTGVSGLAAGHVYGSPLWPLDGDGEAMTGWYGQTLSLRRRQAPTAFLGKIYLSAQAGLRTPDDVDWESDYRADYLTLNGSTNDAFDIGALPLEPWVRTILVIIDQMSDSGRAKLNEVELTLDGLALNGSGFADVDSSKVGSLIDYLLTTYAWFGTGQFTDSTAVGWGIVGDLALAMAPLPQVLADAARLHGCVLRWNPNGTATLLSDPWWPAGAQWSDLDHTFDAGSLRDAFSISERARTVTGIALSATGTDGEPLERVVVPNSATGSGVLELAGYTVPASQLTALAWCLLMREQFSQQLTLIVKGVGEWCRPVQRYEFTWGSISRNQFLCESVTYNWGAGRWECRLGLRQYFR